MALDFDDPVLGSVNLSELLGESRDVCIVGRYEDHTGSMSGLAALELACLASLARHFQPHIVFEIGTFTGRTARLLALNGAPDCLVYTLDLRASEAGHEIGAAFRDTPERARIQQLSGDSRTFDFSPWYGQVDLVYVDGNHDYQYVMADSENALKLCRSGGWIIWHDYWHNAWWSGPTRCVRELRRQYPGIVHLRGTRIALLQKTR